MSTACILYIGQSVSELTSSIAKHKDDFVLLNKCAEITICIILSSLFIFGRIYFFGRLGEKLIRDLRNALFEHILRQDGFFFESQRAGDLVSRIMSDTHVMQLVFIGSVSAAIRNFILFAGSCLMMIALSPPLFVLLLVSSISIGLPNIYFGRKIRALSKKAQEHSATTSSIVEETFSSIRTTKSNQYENECVKSFKNANLSECLTVCSRIIFFGCSVSITTLLTFGMLVALIGYSFLNPSFHGMVFSDFASFLYYAAICGYSVTEFNSLMGSFYRAAGASDRIREMFAILPEPLPKIKNTVSQNSDSGNLIKVDNLCFSYPSCPNKPVLKNVSFTIKKGQKVGIVGPSGSGKSTLFALIQRFYIPSSGQIYIKGKNLLSLPPDEFRKWISVVEQDPFTYSTTIKNNITLGLEGISEEELKQVSKLANCDQFIKNLPYQYDTYSLIKHKSRPIDLKGDHAVSS